MDNPYARLLCWEVWNFMAISHGKCEFDERNIVNLKGYNDSGKSAMLNALKVLLTNSNPTKQVGFIQDDKEYFRIIGYFSDGIQILRDKYVNGQSLYEMYKDGQCIFSTKNGNSLTKVSEVPQPIQDYLGLITYDGVCLNARACFEKQIGVESTGSENYKMFNTVLKSEEIASAGALLNTDKNKLASDIDAVDNELQMTKQFLGTNGRLTKEMITYLKSHDSELDASSLMIEDLSRMSNTVSAINDIVVLPELAIVDDSQLKALESISNIASSVSNITITPELDIIDDEQLQLLESMKKLSSSVSDIVIKPEIPVIDSEQLNLLNSIYEMNKEMQSMKVTPEIGVIDDTQLTTLTVLKDMIDQINEFSRTIAVDEARLTEINTELDNLQQELANMGVKMVKCPDCGRVFDPEHSHV